MDSFGSVLEGDWSSINDMYPAEESDFMAQLVDYCSTPKDLHSESNFRIPYDNTNIDHFALGNTCFYTTLNHDSYYAGDFNHILARDDDFVFCNEEAKDENLSSIQVLASADVYDNVLMQLEHKLPPESNPQPPGYRRGGVSTQPIGWGLMQLELEDQVADPVSHKDVVINNPVQKSKKRSTNSRDVQKNKRSVKAKKNPKSEVTGCMNNKEKNAAVQKRSLGSYSSETDSIASHDSKEVTPVNSNGEVRAIRGSATDPQSLYAKKRRERINEKLRTLQNLVPNGTKVDISTMLEDAVEYVKFLQLQIKLLSSDKWMYAPIAYNGTDLGLDSNLSVPLH